MGHILVIIISSLNWGDPSQADQLTILKIQKQFSPWTNLDVWNILTRHRLILSRIIIRGSIKRNLCTTPMWILIPHKLQIIDKKPCLNRVSTVIPFHKRARILKGMSTSTKRWKFPLTILPILFIMVKVILTFSSSTEQQTFYRLKMTGLATVAHWNYTITSTATYQIIIRTCGILKRI
jgi:hypothetical protein